MTAPVPRPRAPAWIAGALLLGHAVLAWLGRAPGIEASHDDARYVLLARALRHLAYENIWRADPTPHVLYPPGYPAFIALSGWVFGDATGWIILLNIAASTAALGLTFAVLWRIWSAAGALAVLAALAANPVLNERAGQIVSEPVALLATVAALALAAREGDRQRLAAGVTAFLAASVRAFAIAVPFGIAGHWLLQRRFRSALALGLVTAAGAAGWIAWTARAGTAVRHASYVAEVATVAGPSPWAALARRVPRHLAHYVSQGIPSGIGLPGIAGTPVDNAVNALIVVAGLGIGGVVLYRRWRAAAFTLALGLAALQVWPWLEVRYLAPSLPILVAAVLLGVEALVRWRLPRLATPALVALGLVLAVSGLAATAPRVAARMTCDRAPPVPSPTCEPARLHGFFAAIGWLREHGRPGTVTLAAKAATLHYYTGLPMADFDRALLVPSADFEAHLRDRGIHYVVLSGSFGAERTGLAERLEAMCTRLALAAAFPPNGYVFVVGEEQAGVDACEAVRAFRRWVDATRRPGGRR